MFLCIFIQMTEKQVKIPFKTNEIPVAVAVAVAFRTTARSAQVLSLAVIAL